MAEDDEVENPTAEEEPKDVDSSEEEDDDDEVKDAGKAGKKKRDAWERETPYQKSARKAEYKVILGLQDDKDKAIREQAKSLVLSLIHI